MRIAQLELTVFLTGAVVMILELVASRLLAPYTGNSLPVWTSLIGVILASLSAGYYLGGRLADRRPSLRVLALLLAAAAASIAILNPLHAPALRGIASAVTDLRAASVVASLLFVAPSVLCGMVTPFAARLTLHDVPHSGATVGRLYAVSTVGSIAGTFAAGFYLIPSVGSAKMLLVLSGILLASSLLCSRAIAAQSAAAAVLLFALRFPSPPFAPVNATVLLDRDSAFQRLLVYDTLQDNTQVRVMSMGAEEFHSAMLPDRPDQLALPYTRFFRLAAHFRRGISHALVVGGGGYSYPRDFLRSFPNASLDVIELDPVVTVAARELFFLAPNPRLTVYHEDARVFLNRQGPAYDVVFLDVFWNRTMPFHLATVESMRRIYERLDADGVLLMNFVCALEGPRGRLFQAEIATLRAVFPQVLVFAVSPSTPPASTQNMILAALKSPQHPALETENAEMRRYLSNLYTKPVPSAAPLTDDFAPVDQYAAP